MMICFPYDQFKNIFEIFEIFVIFFLKFWRYCFCKRSESKTILLQKKERDDLVS